MVMGVGIPTPINLVGRARFEREVFNRISPSRLVTVGLLILLFPALLWASALVVLASGTLVLGGAALADARGAWGKPPEPAT